MLSDLGLRRGLVVGREQEGGGRELGKDEYLVGLWVSGLGWDLVLVPYQQKAAQSGSVMLGSLPLN